ncbi:hypothetical protein EDD85DRAFT_961565 [Armillaria nabsnona]|nr:hypothetical protein EDD85DRAFT_961565 [Armillaria nabsnona]
MSANPPPLLSMGTTFGAVLIGATLASALFGVTTMLFFVYYRRYSQDSRFYRFSLALLWVLDALHFVLALHILHFYLVNSFGDVPALSNMVWSFKVHTSIDQRRSYFEPKCSRSLTFLFIWRLLCLLTSSASYGYVFSDVIFTESYRGFSVLSSQVPSVSVHYCRDQHISINPILILVSCFLIYEVYTISNFSQFSDISRIMDGALIVGAVSDLTICLSMSFYLFKSREVTISSRTSGRLLVLLRLVLMSGLAETAASVLMLVVFLTLPDTLIFVAIAFPIPRLYIISLLTMLNARTPQPSNGSSHRKARLPKGANETNFIPLNFMDATVTGEESTVGWSLHDQSGGSSTT